MRNDPRVAALERIIQHYEKCWNDLSALDQQLRGSDRGMEDIAAINSQALESVHRSLHVAYARLEREQTRAVATREHTGIPFTGLRMALQ